MVDYWKKREDDWIKANQRSDAEFDKLIQEHYRQAVKDINNSINQFYANYAKRKNISMSEAIKRVANADVKEFSKTAAKMVANKDFSSEANRRLRLYNATMSINRLEMLKSQVGMHLTNMTAAEENELKRRLTKSYQDEIARQAGILGEDRMSISDKQLADVINSSYQNATWSERLWANQDELKGLLDNLLTQAVIQGIGPIELARRISNQMGVKTYVAQRLARTETARVQDQAQMNSFKQYGYNKARWIAEPSACKTCLGIASDNDGIYSLDDIPIIPVHPNCRCSKSAYMDRNAIISDDKANESTSNFDVDNASRDELVRYIHDQFGMNIKETSRTKLSDLALKETLKSISQFEDVYQKFPDKIPTLRAVSQSEAKRAIAWYSHNVRTLNPVEFGVNVSYFNNGIDVLAKMVKQNVDSKWFSNNSDENHIMIHEFGHHIDNQLTKVLKSQGDTERFSSKIFLDMMQDNPDFTLDSVRNISRYANESSGVTEAFAEYVAEAYGPTPGKDALLFKKYLERMEKELLT